MCVDYEIGFVIFYYFYGVCDFFDSIIYVINCLKFNWNYEWSGWFFCKSLKNCLENSFIMLIMSFDWSFYIYRLNKSNFNIVKVSDNIW